jgi:predicted CxxxxCH...CXXCH cytochrome family protein
VDVDPRTEVPPGFYAATAPPITPPVAPYFFSNAFYDFYSDMLPYMTPATVLSAPVGTVSFPLTEAVYEPATQSCRTVACHFAQSTPTSPPLRWGDPFKLPQGGCVSCH